MKLLKFTDYYVRHKKKIHEMIKNSSTTSNVSEHKATTDKHELKFIKLRNKTNNKTFVAYVQVDVVQVVTFIQYVLSKGKKS